MILSLHHVQITIPKDTEVAARTFYCDLLGLPEIEKPESLKNRGGFLGVRRKPNRSRRDRRRC